jgi:hypothetical protein
VRSAGAGVVPERTLTAAAWTAWMDDGDEIERATWPRWVEVVVTAVACTLAALVAYLHFV